MPRHIWNGQTARLPCRANSRDVGAYSNMDGGLVLTVTRPGAYSNMDGGLVGAYSNMDGGLVRVL